jgi:surfeit locus 1 family protein
VILVNRGLAPEGSGGEPAILRAVRPTSAEVDVAGILRTTETRGRFGPTDATGPQRVVNRVDVARLQAQVDEKLAPVFLQLRSSNPPPGDVPILRPLPATDEGPHLSYAVQWFIFATVGAIGWPLLLRKTARDERDEHPEDEVAP